MLTRRRRLAENAVPYPALFDAHAVRVYRGRGVPGSSACCRIRDAGVVSVFVCVCVCVSVCVSVCVGGGVGSVARVLRLRP
jgi:hypothetical protein